MEEVKPPLVPLLQLRIVLHLMHVVAVRKEDSLLRVKERADVRDMAMLTTGPAREAPVIRGDHRHCLVNLVVTQAWK